MNNSKIATIVYKNYLENVDMLNKLFNQKELDALVKEDKDIIRVDYYVNGKFAGNKVYSEKQAIYQILKMNKTLSKISDSIERDGGWDWQNIIERNKTRQKNIAEIEEKINIYKRFITEEGFNNSDLPCELCCGYEDFID